MAPDSSFTSTRRNNQTEKLAVSYLLQQDTKFEVPELGRRKEVLLSLRLPVRFVRSFDLLLHKHDDWRTLDPELNLAKVVLVDIKATMKALPAFPSGFFFGATANEFDLAAALKSRFQFCFTCLHSDHQQYCLLELSALEQRIRNRRIQYQISLR